MIDTHCHVQYYKFDSDRDEMLQRAFNAGIKIICVGTDFEMSEKAVELASKYDTMWASVGLHPNDISIKGQVLSIKEFEEMLQNPKVVAIGEVGLDYYRTEEGEAQAKQRKVLEQFIDLAIKHGKPLIIHCRNAHSDLIEILNTKYLIPNSRLCGVIHSFTGTLDEAKHYIELGFYIGLNGIITFARDYDEVVKQIPLNRILTETDAPYLTPIPHRGKRNEPAYVQFVVQKIAELRGISPDEVAGITTQNAIELFGIK